MRVSKDLGSEPLVRVMGFAFDRHSRESGSPVSWSLGRLACRRLMPRRKSLGSRFRGNDGQAGNREALPVVFVDVQPARLVLLPALATLAARAVRVWAPFKPALDADTGRALR